MTDEEYELHVAQILRERGWQTQVTRRVRDSGVDIIAERGSIRMAVQAKMYGGANRPINPKIIMELCGAAQYADCNASMIATNARVLPDARKVAKKLGIEILIVPTVETASGAVQTNVNAPDLDRAATFGQIWRTYIYPLAGTTLSKARGGTNKILRVDDGGILRRTSTGKEQYIEKEIFRWNLYANARWMRGHNPNFRKRDLASLRHLKARSLYLLESSESVSDALELAPLFRMMASPESEKSACFFANGRERDGRFRYISYHFDGSPTDDTRDPALEQLVQELGAPSAAPDCRRRLNTGPPAPV